MLALSGDGCLVLHNLGAEPLLAERWNRHRLGLYGLAWLRR